MFAVLFLIVFSGITWTSISLYRQKKIELSILVSSFMVTFSILRTCISFYFDFESFIYLYGGIQVVSDYLDKLPQKTKSATRTIPTHEVSKKGIDIDIRNITYYAQPTHTQPLFHNLNLHIPAGTQIAIMGGIGSGKSTLAHLLLRLRNCDKGSILLNNVNIQEITLNSLRKNVHYVSQTPRLFNRTLWENISYGNGKLQVEKVYALLQKLELYDLESVFRKKMHHSVGKHGSELSGGQRQIVLLMRALFNTDYRVLILDEPTSALDSHSRKQVIALIQWISKQSTVIVITHDEKLANYMDRKVWIQDGVVHE